MKTFTYISKREKVYSWKDIMFYCSKKQSWNGEYHTRRCMKILSDEMKHY